MRLGECSVVVDCLPDGFGALDSVLRARERRKEGGVRKGEMEEGREGGQGREERDRGKEG